MASRAMALLASRASRATGLRPTHLLEGWQREIVLAYNYNSKIAKALSNQYGSYISLTESLKKNKDKEQAAKVVDTIRFALCAVSSR